MGGVYNKFHDDGVNVDEKRRLDVFAVDFNTSVKSTKTSINGEWVYAMINIPKKSAPQFGNKQHGFFVDVVQTVMKKNMLGWGNATLNIALRIERVDYNIGNFSATGNKIYDDVWAGTFGISFRPSAQTVIRANYRRAWDKDLLGNTPAKTGGLYVGFSTYF